MLAHLIGNLLLMSIIGVAAERIQDDARFLVLTLFATLLLDLKKANRMGQIWVFCIYLVVRSRHVPGLHYASRLNFPKGMVFILLEDVRKTEINNGSLGK